MNMNKREKKGTLNIIEREERKCDSDDGMNRLKPAKNISINREREVRSMCI